HMALLQFVVDPEYQAKGVGTSLLKNLIHLAKTRFRIESLHIDLPENAPAVKLIEKMGFQATVTQPDFYFIEGKYYSRLVMEKFL
ncbi:MAG: GNAT family N-acetyltransferase, partial [Candidatus Algichlamydia australiensis]|nr:GNAT family N-acetyltransferase [Chlamydiales bacterium]